MDSDSFLSPVINLITLTPVQLSEIIELSIRKVLERKEGTSETPPETKFYTRQEVAAITRCSLPTLDRYTKNGLIKGKRFGNRILYTTDAVTDACTAMQAHKYKR